MTISGGEPAYNASTADAGVYDGNNITKLGLESRIEICAAS